MIYCVEDDPGIRELIVYTLNHSGYEAKGFERGEELFPALKVCRPQLILLDVMLPGEDGISILKRIKAGGNSVPVIMVTAKSAEYDKVVGLDCGADDYMTKPFVPDELLARVRALSRRQGEVVLEEMRYGDLTLHLSTYTLQCGAKSIHLGFKEYEVLRILMVSPHTVVPKEELLTKVWGMESDAEDNNVEVYISFLRKKFFYLGSRVGIGTVRKVGYRLEG